MSEIYQINIQVNDVERLVDVFKYPIDGGNLFVLGEGGEEFASVENIDGNWTLKQGVAMSPEDYEALVSKLKSL